MRRLGVPRLFEFGLCCSACELSVSLVSLDVCAVSVTLCRLRYWEQ